MPTVVASRGIGYDTAMWTRGLDNWDENYVGRMHMEVRARVRHQPPRIMSHFSLASRVLEDKNVDKAREVEKLEIEIKDVE